MTIEDDARAAAPQSQSGDGAENIKYNVHEDDDDLKSLVRILADRSTELAERVALLEGSKPSSQQVGDGNPIVTGIPEKNIDDIEEQALDNRLALIEQRLETYEDEKNIFDTDERDFPLAESTFSLLVTQHPLSVPFVFAVFSIALSISCLCLTLASSINKGTARNKLGIPAGVDAIVRAAQFLGAIVGVIMEDEIPQGLQLIANAAGHTLLLNGQQEVRKRVLVSSILRLVVGYLFLSSLFMNIAQNSDVIEIFYDVLALEFVENIDDTTFALAKRGFFGKKMLFATNQKNNLEQSEMRRSIVLGNRGSRGTFDSDEHRLSTSGLIASNNRVNHFVRFIYFLNAAIVLIGLGYITQMQQHGGYRTKSIRVLFGEEIWENANVQLKNGSVEQRLLIYPYFNGIYNEDGTWGGYPRYVEQNKNDGFTAVQSGFGRSFMPGAEMVYCDEIGSWVFRHPNILTSADGTEEEENECSWLWRSAQTDDYDILSANDGGWDAWVGEVKPLVQISITSNICSERSDCNYFGECNKNGVCECDKKHFGDACEFEMPCPALASEKAHTLDPTKGMVWQQENPIREVVGRSVYNRPLYIQTGLSGEPYDMRLYKILESERSESPSVQPSDIPSAKPSLTPTDWPSISFEPSQFPSQLPSISTNPSNRPSISAKPTPFPTLYPTDNPTVTSEPSSPTAEPTFLGSTTVLPPTPEVYRPSPGPITPFPTAFTTPIPTQQQYKQNEYDEAPDFADVDDFFERQSVHDLEDILEDYSVVLSYTGSRFYGTIINSTASLDGLFPPNYHAFWDQSFNGSRTFIISDTTLSSTPVGVDFFEMRRRVNNMLNPNVQFSYGPYGALIPLMDYEGTGFFHCLDETPSPSTEPSTSSAPTTTFSPSHIPSLTPSISTHPSSSSSPTEECWPVNIKIAHDDYPHDISWTIYSINGTLAPVQSPSTPSPTYSTPSPDYNTPSPTGFTPFPTEPPIGSFLTPVLTEPENVVARGYYCSNDDESCTDEATDKMCLQEGVYEFIIRDVDGIFDPGYYSIMSNGIEIKRGGGINGFKGEETTAFYIPMLLAEPSTQPAVADVNNDTSVGYLIDRAVCEDIAAKMVCITTGNCAWNPSTLMCGADLPNDDNNNGMSVDDEEPPTYDELVSIFNDITGGQTADEGGIVGDNPDDQPFD